MDEDRILKVLNSDFGVTNISDEDYQVYEDYFTDRRLRDESSDEETESQEEGDPINLSELSILQDIPRLDDENLGAYDNIKIDDAITAIEQNETEAVVDENDAGEALVIDHEFNDVNGPFDDQTDRNEVLRFLENGCGCKEKCCNQFNAEDFVAIRQKCAELDYYNCHVNKLDQIILGQLLFNIKF